MVRKLHLKYISYLIGFIIFSIVVFSILDILKSGSEYKIEEARYFENEFHGKIICKWINRGLGVQIDNKGDIQKKYLYGSKNFNLSPSDLFDFLKINDSIVKPENSLDLYIYRNGNKYYFKLGEYINK